MSIPSNPTGHQIFVKLDLYYPANENFWEPKICYSIKTTSEEAIKNLTSPIYSFKKEGRFHSLADLKEVVVDGHSYSVTGGRCSGAVAIEKINKIIENHFKNPSKLTIA